MLGGGGENESDGGLIITKERIRRTAGWIHPYPGEREETERNTKWRVTVPYHLLLFPLLFAESTMIYYNPTIPPGTGTVKTRSSI